MTGISIGSVSVSVVPDLRGFTDKLRSALLPQADALGTEIGRRIADGINASLHGITITANVDVDTAAARAALDDLGSKSVAPAVTLDDSRIVAALEEITVQLGELDRSVTDVRLTLEDGDIGARLDEIGLKLDDIGARDADPKLGLDDSSFNRQLDEDMAKLDAAGSASASSGFGRGGLIAGGILGAVVAGPAIPGALTGAGASVASLGLAYEGISGALKDYTAAQNAATTATGNSARSATSAATQIRSAQVAVSNAETQAAHNAVTSAETIRNAQAQAARDAITSAEAVRNAETQAAHDAITSAETIRNAQAGVSQAVQQAAQQQISAEQQLASAQYAEKQAQQALTDARQQAILTLQQLHNAEADTALSVEQAQLDLEQAKLNAAATDKSATATALQKAQADLSVREAQQRLAEAIQAKANAAAASAKADKEGAGGMPAVVAAQHNLAQAHQSVADAQRNLVAVERQGAEAIAKAEQSLADAVRAASWQRTADAQRVTDAQRNAAQQQQADAQRVSDASRNASWQQQADGQRVTDAQYNLRTAYAAASAAAAGHPSSAATAAQKYAQALAALSPAGRQLVTDILGIKNALKPLEGAAEKGIAPGFTVFANGIKALTPLLAAEVTKMNTILGGFLTSIGHAFQSPSFQATLKSLFAEGNQFIQILTPAIGQMVKAFLDMGAKSAPAVTGLAQGLAAIARGVGDMFTALAPSAPAIGQILSSAGQIIGALGQPVGALLGAFAQGLAPVLAALVPVTKAFAVALTAVIKAIPQPVLEGIVIALAEIGFEILAMTSPVAAVIIVIALLAAGIDALVTHWAVVWSGIKRIAEDMRQWLYDDFVLPIGRSFGTQLPQDVEAGLKSLKDWIWNDFLLKIAGWFTKTLPGWLDSSIAFLKSRFVAPFEEAIKGAWDWVVSSVFNPMKNFFLSVIPGWWHTTITNLNSTFVAPFQNAFRSAWTWVVSNVFGPMRTFITQTVPGWWTAAVSAIGSVWNGVKSVASAPVKFIVDTIFDKGIVPVVNAVAGLIGLHGLIKPFHIPGLAAGGKVTQGTTSTADDVLARVSKGETVVSAEHSGRLAGIFAAVGVPGYAAGGIPGGGQPPGVTGRFGPIPGVGGVLHDIGHALAGLAGDALAVAAKAILDPLLNALPGGGSVLGADLKRIPRTIVDDLIAKLRGTAPAGGGAGGAPGGLGGPASAGAASAQAYARSRLSAYGWGAGQMAPLIGLWNEESGWNRLARNASSGAYGIPQALPGSKMGPEANPPTSSAAAQINWGLGYIKGRYGSPAAAYAFENSHSPAWYDAGGWMPPGLSLTMNGTGRPEPVLSGRQWDLISSAVAGGDGTGLGGRHVARKLDRMIALLERAPAQTAGGVGQALNGTARGAVHAGYFRTTPR